MEIVNNVDYFTPNDSEDSAYSYLYANVPFVADGINLCSYLGESKYPLSFLPTKKQKESGLVSILTFPWFTNDVYPSRWEAILNRFGVTSQTADEKTQKNIIVSYLLSISACLLEIPSWKTSYGVHEASYKKIVCTTNPRIAAKFVNASKAELEKFTKKMVLPEELKEKRSINLMKLNVEDDGSTKITFTRKPVCTDDVICTPLIMLDTYLQALKKNFTNSLLRVCYLKDNDTVRYLDTTINKDILMSIYNDESYVNNVLESISLSGIVENHIFSHRIAKGYISVPEVGASIYAPSTKAINLTRIISLMPIREEDVDRTFIKVDLDKVSEKFISYMRTYTLQNQFDIVKAVYESVTNTQMDPNITDINVLNTQLETYVNTSKTYWSTQFLRYLHKFMITNVLLFPTYDGCKENTTPYVSPNGTIPTAHHE